MEPAVQRRHPLRRHGRALARRPRSPSTPPGPHPAARRGLRSRAGCSRCACAPPRRRTAGYPVIGSQARSARCRPSHCSPAARSITMHTMHCGSAATADAFVPVARSGRRELLDAGDNAAFAWSFDTGTYPKAAFTIRFGDDQELDLGSRSRPSPQEASDPGQWITSRRAIFAVRDPRPLHEICHRRPVSSWVAKRGARLSRAGVATRPTSTSLCVSSERPRPALPGRNSCWDSHSGGRLISDRGSSVPGCTVHLPQGGAGPPRMGASAVHPRAGQVRRRPGNGATDGADQGGAGAWR